MTKLPFGIEVISSPVVPEDQYYWVPAEMLSSGRPLTLGDIIRAHKKICGEPLLQIVPAPSALEDVE